MDHTPVIIVGGGLSGIVAAIELLDQKIPVTLIDRDTEANLGGLAKWSFGGLFYVDSPFQRKMKIKDSPELAFEDWLAFGELKETDTYPRAWAEKLVTRSTPDVYEWLKLKKITYIPVVQWLERGQKTRGNSVPRFHMVWGTGHRLAEVLVYNLLHHPSRELLNLLCRKRAEEIIFADNAAKGVRIICEETSKENTLYGNHILIAAGGICGNIDRVKDKHWDTSLGKPPARLLSGSHPYADGRMWDAAVDIGAQVSNTDKIWMYAGGVHHPDPNSPQQALSLVPPKSAIWLNYRGERIGPTPLVSGYDTRFLVEQICKQEKKYSWQVLNYKIASKELGVSGSQYNDAIRYRRLAAFIRSILMGNPKRVDLLMESCKDFVVADSLEDLVKKMNALEGNEDLSLKVLRKSIANYDREVELGQDSKDLQRRQIYSLREYRGDKSRTHAQQKILDPKAFPLIAIREHIMTRKTLGGIQTNLNSEVLDTNGNIIKGLYAVGEAAGFGGGGIHGKRALEGTFLAGAILTARRAAAQISSSEKPLAKLQSRLLENS